MRAERWGEWLLLLASACFAWIGFHDGSVVERVFVPGPRAHGVLRVVTWNVGRKGGAAGLPMADVAVGDVVSTILELDADLVFLQEISGESQYGEITRTLPDAWYGHMSRNGDRRVVVLARGGSLKAWGWISQTTQRVVVVRYSSDHFPAIGAVSLHADAFSARRRNRQIGQAVDRLFQIRGVDCRLLTGDLNIDLDLDKRRDLFSDNEHLDVESYNYVTEKLFDAGIGRGSTADPDRRLDYIFINAKLAVRSAGPVLNHRVGDMDHDPFVADLELATR